MIQLAFAVQRGTTEHPTSFALVGQESALVGQADRLSDFALLGRTGLPATHNTLKCTVVENLPELPPRQGDTLRFAVAYWRQHGRAPTQREIARGIGARTTNPAPYIAPLLKRGLLRRDEGGRRNLRPTALAERWFATQPLQTVMELPTARTAAPALPPRQFAALRLIVEYVRENRRPPTQREIATGIRYRGRDPSAYVGPLLKKGYLTRSDAPRRNLLPTDLAAQLFARLPRQETLPLPNTPAPEAKA